ncbi:DUF2953 domain-containing protein [Ructibacterium gallinarum]|uniref:DUF2953 domain-containing protein n=1 Tax=Ructibacterium gallinarum TaxID=2779355 RepID=A0A9D5LWZ4_9FIRM|nr:DUF2953 domain-containing protein [Ructibacterium gallinarum]MBE5039318.1 DUF2953 domain-containing protein [Ructibacterium gallinarum]
MIVWILLGLLAAILLVVGITTWLLWEIRLHYTQNTLTIYVRVLRFKKKVFCYKFATKEKNQMPEAVSGVKQTKRTTEKQGASQEKKPKWVQKLQEDKKRIYNPEKGGYQPGGLEEVFTEYQELWSQFRDVLGGIFKDLRYKIEIPKTVIRLVFGTGNPAHTGMAFGTAWGMIGMLYPMLCRYFHIAYPDMQITPDFNQKCFALEAKSIIKVRPAHIINAVIKQALRLAVTYCYKHFSKESVKYG